MHRHHHRILNYFILGLILAIITFLSFVFRRSEFLDIEVLRNLLLHSGFIGYILLVLLVAASVPLPLPSAPFILVGGFVYGTALGSTIALLGIIIGSTISFLLVRRFGERLLEKMVDKHHLQHLEHVFNRRGISAALISYAIPIFPSDAISSFLGLTHTKFRTFMVILIIGHIPRILLTNSLGNDLREGFSLQTGIVIFFSIMFILIAWYREKVKKFFFKELHELEHEAIKMEREVEKEVKKEVKLVEEEVKTEMEEGEKEGEEDTGMIIARKNLKMKQRKT